MTRFALVLFALAAALPAQAASSRVDAKQASKAALVRQADASPVSRLDANPVPAAAVTVLPPPAERRVRVVLSSPYAQ